MTATERWKIQRDLKKLFRDKKTPAEIDEALRDSLPLRGRLMEEASAELIGKAMDYGIMSVDLMPFRFGSPMWLEEGEYRYLSAEARQIILRAIDAKKAERTKAALLWIGPIAGTIGAITGLIAMLKK